MSTLHCSDYSRGTSLFHLYYKNIGKLQGEKSQPYYIKKHTESSLPQKSSRFFNKA